MEKNYYYFPGCDLFGTSPLLLSGILNSTSLSSNKADWIVLNANIVSEDDHIDYVPLCRHSHETF